LCILFTSLLATEIAPLKKFIEAEEHHPDYLFKTHTATGAWAAPASGIRLPAYSTGHRSERLSERKAM